MRICHIAAYQASCDGSIEARVTSNRYSNLTLPGSPSSLSESQPLAQRKPSKKLCGYFLVQALILARSSLRITKINAKNWHF